MSDQPTATGVQVLIYGELLPDGTIRHTIGLSGDLDALTFGADDARCIAAALMEAADEIDGPKTWLQDPLRGNDEQH
jgi:hypothetical protein